MSAPGELHVTIKGIPEVKAALDKCPDVFMDELVRAVNALAVKVQAKAKMNAPTRLNRLRQSIHMQPAARLGFSVVGRVNAGVDYAYFIETGLGRSGRPIKRHLAPIAPEYARAYGLIPKGGRAHDREVYFMWVDILHQPFLFPALEAVRTMAKSEFTNAARTAIAKVQHK